MVNEIGELSLPFTLDKEVPMSLRPQAVSSIPEETVRVARAAFPKSSPAMRMRDAFGSFFTDAQFATLFPKRGRPAAAPWRLALVLVMQFAEGLSDRQAADAVRSRIDWKYALGLELTDPGFDYSVLSQFRQRLLTGNPEQQLLETMLTTFKERGLLKAGGRQRTDSTHVLAAVRVLNRLERVGETLRQALNALAVVAPDWLEATAPAAWYARYGSRMENSRFPKSDQERDALATQIGEDGRHLLSLVESATTLPWLLLVPAVGTLRTVWQEQYTDPPAPPRLREVQELAPAGSLIASPYDPEARFSRKQTLSWVGYKVHLTETCDPERPHLITDVQTTPSTTRDEEQLLVTLGALAPRHLLPREHLVDAGYTDARVLAESKQQYGVEVTGPVTRDPSWQAQAGEGFDKAHFLVDWEAREVTCPAGKKSRSWTAYREGEGGRRVGQVRFAKSDCAACEHRQQCTRGRGPRNLELHPREEEEALQEARRRQETGEFRSAYNARAGIEGTHGQAIRRCGMRHCRYLGVAKSHLQHLLTACALNWVRVNDWLLEQPRATTRISRFAQLAPAR
jgi:transposase